LESKFIFRFVILGYMCGRLYLSYLTRTYIYVHPVRPPTYRDYFSVLSARGIPSKPTTAYTREQEKYIWRYEIGGSGDARRTWKINLVNRYGHVVHRGQAFVIITIRRSASVLR
jgi:hypothetical protein